MLEIKEKVLPLVLTQANVMLVNQKLVRKHAKSLPEEYL